jgi:Leu/Phe-tRNA-protein transferase
MASFNTAGEDMAVDTIGENATAGSTMDYRRELAPHEFRGDYATFQDFTGCSMEQELGVAMQLKKSSKYFRRLRYVKSCEDVPKLLESVREMKEDFTWSVSFDTQLVANLARHGFLPMCIQAFSDYAVLAPKLHKKRCIMDFSDLHVPKSVKKRSSRFRVSVDECFDYCIKMCCEQHGDHCWFYPALIKAYKNIFRSPNGVNGVSMHSVEVWFGDDVVAGEIGYACGGVYTSLSGFSNKDSAGTIQCCCIPKLLKASNFDFWDLGMTMEYKTKLGGRAVPRHEFLGRLFSSRDKQTRLVCPKHNHAREILNMA